MTKALGNLFFVLIKCPDTTLKIRVQFQPPPETVTAPYTLIDNPHLMQRHNEPHIFTLSKHTGRV